MSKILSVLGSTGSIGTQALEVAEMHNFRINALAAHSNISLLEKQTRKFRPDTICIFNKDKYSELKSNLSDTNTEILCGMDGLCEIAS
ncbi:MAG TPA: 1-deoxy-D-xylulose-5-phosphate reductoisomerase, partial [Ruminococcus sp.]|nr:1-deoxy-D-xylulose-5-phosphate reductoisomerase [Ruminococcus sp.]